MAAAIRQQIIHMKHMIPRAQRGCISGSNPFPEIQTLKNTISHVTESFPIYKQVSITVLMSFEDARAAYSTGRWACAVGSNRSLIV